MSLDKALADNDDELFEIVRRCYCEDNKDYLQSQFAIAAQYLTDDQKAELRQKDIAV